MDNFSYSQVDLIREVFHYRSRHEGSTMVFKIDCPVTEDPGFPALVKDLALLAKTGFRVIIVPGARENIDAVFKRYDINSSYISSDASNPDLNVRLTSSQAIPFVEMAAFDVAGRFMTFFSGSRVEALIGNFVRARGLGIINGVDTENTGAVDKIYVKSLVKVLDLGMVPILPCIGWNPSGKPYNVSSDEIALTVSKALQAAKLFIVSVHTKLQTNIAIPNGLETRSDGSLIRLNPQQAESLIALNSGLAGLTEEQAASRRQFLQELKLGTMASREGVHRVHIVDGREEGSILNELFSNLGAGTMIYTDEYDSIRPFHSRDLPDVLRIMEPLMKNGILVRRNAEQIQQKKDDYFVLEIDGSLRACGALYDWGEAQGEIAAVATDPQHKDLGLGRKIVGYLVEKARKSQMDRVFVLTTQTQDWFEALGFKETTIETLPEKKRNVYDKDRKSKIFALELK